MWTLRHEPLGLLALSPADRVMSPLMRSTSRSRLLALGVPLLGLVATAWVGTSCSSGVDIDKGAGGGKLEPVPVGPGEVCEVANPDYMSVRFQTSQLVLPPCAGADCGARTIRLMVNPDICGVRTVSFASSDPSVVEVPKSGAVRLHTAHIDLALSPKKPGVATITASLPRADDGEPQPEGAPLTATLEVEVLDPALPACSGTATKAGLTGGDTLMGSGGLAGASVGLPAGAEKPNDNGYLWHVDPFDATLGCGADQVPAGEVALGPAITFGPSGRAYNRELPVSIPVNPARMPAAARARHIHVVYTGPGFKSPRVIPVADPRVEKVGGAWALSFKAPRLGTYQATVAEDAGTKTFKRRLTHRAVIGVSMGGGGSAMFGLRHHDMFDVVAPLGGPVDWTWMLHNIEQNHLGGFRPIAKGTTLADIQLAKNSCTTDSECLADEICLGVKADRGQCTLMPKALEPYSHPQTFNNWWYEYPRGGNGGRFTRTDYSQIFRDLALMFGNPNGENLTPGGENLPAGVPPTDPSVAGPSGDCHVWVDPIDGPDHARQQEIDQRCPTERCANTLTLSNYFDDEYNPDGIFPVITVCDGNSQDEALTPYANTWHADGNGYPLEVGLAVDYNGNGVRDELEPIIRAGHEPYRDFGVDGVPSHLEPGYVAGVNDDPSGDDYDPQYNPNGTEGNQRYDEGEPYDDVGLDGVAGTKQQPAGGYAKPGDGYDVGEGDGKFTLSSGLRRFWDRDTRSIIHRWAPEVPGGELTDEALRRVDLWTDGGTRDLFNFGVDAAHLVGSFAGRGREAAYFTTFTGVPGLDPAKPKAYLPQNIDWDGLQGIVMQRYGKVDPSPADVESGSGQHVGTANEMASRLQSALYFIASRWPEQELRLQHESSLDAPDPDADECEISGTCSFDFTSKSGRVGPVGVSLPPGYAHKDLKNHRYPVIYMLHGYGQGPQDLEAAIIFLRNWMNSASESVDSRLAKAILVYVDGRCRIGPSGKAECLRGTFFADSPRADGAKTEQWWLELMSYVDTRFRTMGETEIDWTE